MTDKNTELETDLDDGLTPEERAALAEDEGAESAGEEGKEEPKAKEGEGDEGKEDKSDQKPPADKQDDEEGKVDEEGTEEGADGKVAPESDTSKSAPILIAQPLPDLQEKLNAIATKKEELLDRFDEGDMSAKEYQKEIDALAKEERAIERAQDRAELAVQMEQQRLQNDWNAQCNSFVESHQIYKENPRLYKALDAEVRELASKAETANWSGQKFLEEAHKNLKEAFKFEEPNGSKPIERPKRPDLPPNLAKVPAADVEDTNGGRFAVLDRLAETDPAKYQDTLDNMPDRERDAYLARG
jgi:chromosome segregation ATPase